jgi:hypothetical protein
VSPASVSDDKIILWNHNPQTSFGLSKYIDWQSRKKHLKWLDWQTFGLPT